MLRVVNLSKTYPGGVKALKGVSFAISSGMFGLLGPNGAGKTTLMRIIATLLDPDEGEVYWKDIDVFKEPLKFKKVLGYLPQEFGVYSNISAYDMLSHFAALKGYSGKDRKKVVDYVLDVVNLWNDRKRKLGEYSGGMKKKFGIAVALLGNPEILIVDEPTAGLDPYERRRFLNLLSDIAENRVVILSTHIVGDVEGLCNEVAIINNGEIVVQGNPEDLIKSIDGKVFQKQIDKKDTQEMFQKYRVLNFFLRGGKAYITIYYDENPGADWQSVKPSLEEVYFYYVGYHTI